MTKPNSTEIIVVLDRSGSMSTIAADMRGGFDSFIGKQKETSGECKVSLAQFDHLYEDVYTAMEVRYVPPLNLQPRGATALLDAVGRTIISAGERFNRMPESDRPSKVIVMIISDGYENASREFTYQKIAEMTAHQKSKYGWEFIYLGANQDAFQVGAQLGIHANAVTYKATRGGAAALFATASAGISSYREEKCSGSLMMNQAAYDAALKDAEKDLLGGIVIPTSTGSSQP